MIGRVTALLLAHLAALLPVQDHEQSRLFLARAEAAPFARAALACRGERHLVLHLGPDREGAVSLDLEGLRARSDLALLEEACKACCIEIQGGDLAGWWQALFPGGKPSALTRALHTAFRRGTPFLGIDAGAALLCAGGPALTGTWPLEASDREDLDPSGRALTGLSFGPLPLLAFGEDKDSGPGALLAAMERHGVEAGAFLEGSVWLDYSSRTRDLTVHGPGRLCLFVLDGPLRAREVKGALWELGEGARWQAARQRIFTRDKGQPLTGIVERRSFEVGELEITSRPGTLIHQVEGHLPTRVLLALRLVRRGRISHGG